MKKTKIKLSNIDSLIAALNTISYRYIAGNRTSSIWYAYTSYLANRLIDTPYPYAIDSDMYRDILATIDIGSIHAR